MHKQHLHAINNWSWQYRPPSSFTRASTDSTLLQPSVEAQTNNTNERFYCAIHFSAKRGLAIACRPSVCPSVTLVDCDHIGWNSSEIISPLVSLGCSLSADPSTPRETPGNFGPKWPTPCWFERRRHSIANCGRMVTYVRVWWPIELTLSDVLLLTDVCDKVPWHN